MDQRMLSVTSKKDTGGLAAPVVTLAPSKARTKARGPIQLTEMALPITISKFREHFSIQTCYKSRKAITPGRIPWTMVEDRLRLSVFSICTLYFWSMAISTSWAPFHKTGERPESGIENEGRPSKITNKKDLFFQEQAEVQDASHTFLSVSW